MQTNLPRNLGKTISSSEVLQTVRIDNPEILKQRNKEKVIFSFMLYDRTHGHFNLGETQKDWFIGMLDVLKEASKGNWFQFVEKRTYDVHLIDWNDDRVLHKFNCSKDALDQFEAFQFRLERTKGRVSGFLLGNTFYIYWLDSEHNLYKSKGFPEGKRMTPPKTSYEILEDVCADLRTEIEELKAERNSLEQELYKYIEDTSENPEPQS